MEGQSSDVLINPSMRLVKVSGSTWKYTVEVDRAWLTAPEREYPIYIDPTIQRGPNYAQSFKSDGSVFNGQLHVGNTRQNNQNVYWRAFARYDYSGIPGNFIGDAQIGLAYSGLGTTTHQTGEISHANCLGYDCIGIGVTSYGLSNGSTWTAGDAVKTRLAAAFA